MNKIIRHSLKSIYFLAVIFVFFRTYANAQTPAKCFEIESILADACGSPEGENEMVRFIIGPTAFNASDLDITWPNNPYLGISPQTAATSAIINTLNSTILSCGILIEPTGGILPAGKRVLLITSTAVNTSANSFANLTDTLYVIFQIAGNTAGHFVNYNSTPGIRTLIMKQISTGCSDTASYDRSLLTNQTGGHGGSSALCDGGTIEYVWPGYPAATYINNGCQAPIIGITSNAGNDVSVCAGGTINLNGTASGNYNLIFWRGGTGIFSNINTLTASYTLAPSELDSVVLSMGAAGNCNDTVFSTMTVYITQPPTAAITPGGNVSICPGATVTLTASGGSTYSWSTGGVNSSVVISTAGTYTVTASNSCGSQQAVQSVSVAPAPSVTLNSSVTTLCNGSTLILWASGVGNFLWSTGSANDSITVSSGGNYSVTASNSCGSASDLITINSLSLPYPVITPAGLTTICPGDSVTLNASGGSTYVWSTGQTGSSINADSQGIYSVTASNTCGSDLTSVNITEGSVTAQFSGDLYTGIYPFNVNFTNTSSASAVSYLWSFGDNTNSTLLSPSHTFEEPGTYTVILQATTANGCTDSYSLTIVVLENTSSLEIPNIFTPNGDGKNDFFLVNGVRIKDFNCVIYDRWGLKIAEVVSVTSYWDGRTQAGTAVSSGTYYYVIKAKGWDNKDYDKSGFLQLLR